MNNDLTKSIAILEPHQILRQCLAEVLIYLNYNVVIKSGDTLDFIEQLATLDELPEIIISEIELNDVPDVAIFRHLRFHYPEIKLLAFSANNSEWTVDLALQQGANAFIEKGCSLKNLQQVLQLISTRQFEPK